MKNHHLLIALVLAATSGVVLAQNASAANVQGKTRAQVVQELEQARADGSMVYNDADYPKLPAFVSSKSRAQVLAELKQARADGSLSVPDSDFPKQSFVSTKTRAQVMAELVEYNKNPDPQHLYLGY